MCLGDSVPLGSIMIMGSHLFSPSVHFLSDKPILHISEPKILEMVECSLPKGQATLVSWGTRLSLSLLEVEEESKPSSPSRLVPLFCRVFALPENIAALCAHRLDLWWKQ